MTYGNKFLISLIIEHIKLQIKKKIKNKIKYVADILLIINKNVHY